jgi:hypothetical protein
MKYFMILAIAVLAFGCKGARESFETSVGGMKITEHTTTNLRCGVARFGDNLSASCVAK